MTLQRHDVVEHRGCVAGTRSPPRPSARPRARSPCGGPAAPCPPSGQRCGEGGAQGPQPPPFRPIPLELQSPPRPRAAYITQNAPRQAAAVNHPALPWRGMTGLVVRAPPRPLPSSSSEAQVASRQPASPAPGAGPGRAGLRRAGRRRRRTGERGGGRPAAGGRRR